MPRPVPLVEALLAAVTAALAFYPALRLRRGRPLGAYLASCTAIALTPLIIPADRPLPRFVSAVAAVTLGTKLFDLHVGAGVGNHPGFWSFLLFLPNVSALVFRKIDAEQRPSRAFDLARLPAAAALTLVAAWLFMGAYLIDWRSLPFALEHCVKVTTFFLGLVSVAWAAMSAFRLLGGKGREGVGNPFAARTPADFWRSYNRPAQQFFYEDVFKLVGGRRAWIGGTLATFAVSAAIHEYVFDIASSRIQGYQTAFFLIQAVAVMATIRIRPRGWNAVAWVIGTTVFNLATSVLFFASVNELAPFYSRPVPWLWR